MEKIAMKRSKFTKALIVFALRQADTGVKVAEVCRLFRLQTQERNEYYIIGITNSTYITCYASQNLFNSLFQIQRYNHYPPHWYRHSQNPLHNQEHQMHFSQRPPDLLEW